MAPAPEETDLLYGVNPVMEALERRASFIDRVYVARESGPRLGRLQRRAREAGVPVSLLPRTALARKLGVRSVHQGVAARVVPIPYADTEELCRSAASRPDGLLVLVDGVTDAGNLGAILRTAAAAGADGVVLAAQATAGLGGGVAKASAGAMERVPVGREPKLARRIAALRASGFRVVGLAAAGSRRWDEERLVGRLALVLGSEDRGLRPSVAHACDIHVAIPMGRGVESLNVAVAAGVLLFEAVRQRRASRHGP